MAITETFEGGGRSDPAAASASVPGTCQRFELWPHRSLSRRGLRLLIGAVVLGMLVPLWQVPIGGALLVIAVPCLAAPSALAVAFWANNRAARMKEEIWLTPELLRFTRSGPAARGRTEDFNPYWLRIEVRSDGRIANRILMSEGRRRVAVGDFLSPRERLELAQVLRARLGAGRVLVLPPVSYTQTEWESADDLV